MSVMDIMNFFVLIHAVFNILTGILGRHKVQNTPISEILK
jgi:hypothetical protein